MKSKLVLGLVTLLGTVGLFATNDASARTVVKGDTLWDIAQENGTTVSELQRINGISGHLIYPGQYVYVPGEVKQTQKRSYNIDSNKATKVIQETPKPKAKVVATQPVKQKASNNNIAGRKLNVEATAYGHDCYGCSGTTATGIKLQTGMKVIAVDPNVIPLGSKVYVPGYGTAIAGDTGGRIKGNIIDVYVGTEANSYSWGRKNLTITILD